MPLLFLAQAFRQQVSLEGCTDRCEGEHFRIQFIATVTLQGYISVSKNFRFVYEIC